GCVCCASVADCVLFIPARPSGSSLLPYTTLFRSDETVPLACGCIGQETTGAGGLGKALRTVPVVLGIADRVRERGADDAWIVDRSEEHTSDSSHLGISYAVFCLKKKITLTRRT